MQECPLERAREALAAALCPHGAFATEARNLLEALGRAHAQKREREARALAASYGGLVKRWRRFVIETLTAALWAEHDRSRESIRDWQQRTFGQSVASARLNRHATPERWGGGRAELEPIGAALEDRARTLFKDFRDKVKDV